MSVINMATHWLNFRRIRFIYLSKIKISYSNLKKLNEDFSDQGAKLNTWTSTHEWDSIISSTILQH